MAVPGPRDNALQYIDARDLGEFVVTIAANTTLGAFHAAGPYPAGSFLFDVVQQISEQIAPNDTHLVEISPRHIKSHHLDSRFPLWSGSAVVRSAAIDLDPAQEPVAAGLTFRDLSDSVEDVIEWWDDRESPSWWLTREQEAMLVRTNP